MNSIKCKDARRTFLAPSFHLAIAAICCVNSVAIAEERSSYPAAAGYSSTSPRTTANSSAKPRLQWQPQRKGASDRPAVRTVRYEQDVFADGPALQASDKSEVKRAALNLNQAPPRSPFDEPETTPTTPPTTPEATPTPMPVPPAVPEQTPPSTAPLDTTPTPSPMPLPTETTPPLEFRPPTTPGFNPTPSPDTTTPGAPRELQPPTTTPPSTMFPPSRSPMDQFELTPREQVHYDPAQDCETAYAKLRANTIDKLSVSIKVAGEAGTDVPFECKLSDDPFDPRSWKLTTFTWKASALCHKPVYFEEVALERYGHSHGPVCEYFVSFAHFFGNVALLPYHMGVETPTECIYTLGYYRPGNCAPYMIDPFPISLRGAAFGAVGYCGTVALFP